MEAVNRVLIEDKIFEMFEDLFTKMDYKLNRDYAELRNLSIKYTEMYHDLNENVIPQINSLDENFPKSNSKEKTNTILNTPNKVEVNSSNLNDRSKTPIKNIVLPNKTNAINKTSNEENKFGNKKENQITPMKNDQSKTPVTLNNKITKKINIARTERSKLTTMIVKTQIIGNIQNVIIKDNADKEIEKRKSLVSENESEKINVSGKKTIYFDNLTFNPANSIYNENKSARENDKSTSEFQGATVKEKQEDSGSKRKNSKSKVPTQSTNLRTRDLTPLPVKRKFQNILDMSGDISKNENKSKYLNNNKYNIPHRKPSYIVRNNSIRAAGKDIKPEYSVLNPKRNSAQEEKDLKSRRSKDRLFNEKEDWHNIKNESNLKRESPADTLTKCENVKQVIVTPMKKKEFVFCNNSEECLFILATSDLIDERMRMCITLNVKEVYDKIGLRNVLDRKIQIVQNEINRREEIIDTYLQNSSNEILLNKKFTPSKTAQNGLNFVTKDEEMNLSKSKLLSNEVLNIFKLIYIIIDEKYEEGEIPNSQNIIQHLTGEVFKKLRVENLKSLFLNYITPNLKFSDDQYNNMRELIKENPNLLSPTDLLKMNRCLSYMSFFLKEIYDFCSGKLSDGTPAYKIRRTKNELNILREKMFIMRKLQCQYIPENKFN